MFCSCYVWINWSSGVHNNFYENLNKASVGGHSIARDIYFICRDSDYSNLRNYLRQCRFYMKS